MHCYPNRRGDLTSRRFGDWRTTWMRLRR